MNPQVLEKYKKMKYKFKLPHLFELKETFKIDINEDERLFDNIRNEISEKIFTFTERIIEPIIGGADSFSCLFEQNMLTEKEREKLFTLYKKTQVLKWENNLLMIHQDDKQIAQWIKKTWMLWNSSLMKELSELCEKMSNSWKDMKFKNEKTIYHG